MERKRIYAALLFVWFLLCAAPLSAQRYLSVPLSDPVYHLLETGQLRGLIDPLPSVKPYTQDMVARALHQMQEHADRLTLRERSILEGFIAERYRDRSWWEEGAIRTDTGQLTAKMGAYIDGAYSVTMLEAQDEPYQGLYTFLSTYLDGGLGRGDYQLSYRFAMDFGGFQADNTRDAYNAQFAANDPDRMVALTSSQYAGFTPYTFTKPGDGYSYPLFDLFKNRGGSDAELAFRMKPEIATEFFDGSLRLGFSRTPRNWGLGEDSIILSGQARPFLGLEVHAEIFEWMDYAVLVGTLENSGSSGADGWLNQKMITQKNVDMRPFPWLYIGIHEGVVWPKRFELGYINPLIFSSLYQGMGGDFDNIIGGITLGGRVPGYAEAFATVYLDEFSPNERGIKDFFERVRNLFSVQAGVRGVVPGVPYGTLLLQYTKIEPFTYTHPPTATPWIQPYGGKEPYQSFISDGYGVPSRLDPNSDEMLARFKFAPLPEVFISVGYQYIRHGHYGGFYNMPLKAYSSTNGSILPDGMDDPYWLGGNDDAVGNLQKRFLADGPYEKYHIASIKGDVDLSGILPIQMRLSLMYAFTHQNMFDRSGEPMSDEAISASLRPDFERGMRNTFTVSFRVY